MPRAKEKHSSRPPEEQFTSFVAKFEPESRDLIRLCRAELRKLLPTAVELIYDNYNFFVIGYCSTSKPSTCIVSLAAAANGVGLSFYHGASLEDPDHVLQGEGKQNRFVRLPSVDALRTASVVALIRAAIAQTKVPLATNGVGVTIIQSVSAKQRPRRKN
jgi:hypothetical protein